MLSPPDSHLVRREPDIPGLALLLDNEAFTDLLRQRCSGASVLSVMARYVRYKPGTGCLVAYRVAIPGGEIDVYAKALRRESRAKLDKAMSQQVIAGPLGPGRFVLDDLRVVVSMFPNDIHLRSLRRIGGEDRSLIERISRDYPDLRDATVTRLRYKPERRFVARLDVHGKASALLKIYAREGYPAARIVGESLRNTRGGPERQRLMFRSDRGQALVFDWFDGVELGALIRRGEATDEILSRTGSSLAALHALEANGLHAANTPGSGREEALEELTKWTGAVMPWTSRRVRRLAREVTDLLSASNRGSLRLVHGDFNASQVLVAGDVSRLIDLDEARMGDPLEDLGNFAAHLDRAVVHGDIQRSVADGAVTTFLEGYVAGGTNQSVQELTAHRAAALFRLLPEPFRQRHDAWDEITIRLIDRIEEILGSARRHGPGIESSPGDTQRNEQARTLPALIDRACDRDVVQACFRAAPELDENLQILSVRLLRQRKSKRALLEYRVILHPDTQLEQEVILLGKIRVKGLDEATFETCLDLRRHGFGDTADDGIAIPEPVAKVPGLRMWLQRKVAGVSATKAIFEDRGNAVAARVGEAAAKIHSALVSPGRRHTLIDELTILRRRLEPLALEPALSDRALRVLQLAEACQALLPSRPIVPIHRDFYADHLLFDGDRVWILDLDLFCEGDPAVDVGNFIAHLEELAIRRHGGYEAAAGPSRALLERYRAIVGEEHDLAIEVYTGLSLARLAGISRSFDTRREWTAAILERATQRLESVQLRAERSDDERKSLGGES